MAVARLIPFVFNVRDTLVLVFEAHGLRFVQDGAPIEVMGVPVAVATPYAAADLAALQYVQSGDVVTVVHPSYPPYELRRTSNTVWTFEAIDFGAIIQPPTSQSNVSTGYNSAATSIVLAAGGGALMPATPFNATWWNRTLYAKASDDPNVESVTVTARATDTLTVTRAQEGTTATNKNTGGSTYALAASPKISGYLVDLDDDLTGWVFVVTAVSEDGEESLAGRSAEVPVLYSHHPVVVSWSATTGAESYRIYRRPPRDSGVDVGAYGFVGVSSTVKFVDYARDPDFAQQPPIEKVLFASTNNYPSVVAYWQQRRVFANTNTNPNVVWTSATGLPNNFNLSVPLLDSDPVTFRLQSETVDAIRHVLSFSKLVVLTEGAEWIVPGDQYGVLTPFAIGARIASSNGVNAIRPIKADNRILFIQALGATIRELDSTVSVGLSAFQGRDVAIFSTHFFDGHTITDMAWQQELSHVAWLVRDDGALLGLSYIPEQELLAWHRHDTDGIVENVCVVPEGGQHRVYIIVTRDVDGDTVRYLERFASPFEADVAGDAWFVDAALEYDGRPSTPASSVSGLDHLEGCDVAIYAYGKVTSGVSDDTGYVLANPLRSDLAVKTVTAGVVALGASYLRVVVGLPFIADVETLDIDTPSGRSLKTSDMLVNRVGMLVDHTRNVWAGASPPTDDDVDPLELLDAQALSTDADFDDLVTDYVEINTRGLWSTNGRMFLRSIDPTPMTVLSVVPQGFLPDVKES